MRRMSGGRSPGCRRGVVGRCGCTTGWAGASPGATRGSTRACGWTPTAGRSRTGWPPSAGCSGREPDRPRGRPEHRRPGHTTRGVFVPPGPPAATRAAVPLRRVGQPRLSRPVGQLDGGRQPRLVHLHRVDPPSDRPPLHPPGRVRPAGDASRETAPPRACDPGRSEWVSCLQPGRSEGPRARYRSGVRQSASAPTTRAISGSPSRVITSPARSVRTLPRSPRRARCPSRGCPWGLGPGSLRGRG